MAESKRTIVVTCSGASNTGTTADRVARALCVEDMESFDLLCLSAFAIKKAQSIKKLQEAQRIVVLEGCPSRCATEILRQGNFQADLVLEMVSDYGVKKSMVPEADMEKLGTILADAREKV